MSSLETLRRSATDAKWAGVCGGLAARWRIDPTLVRVGAALLALSGGLGLVLYVAGWLLIPLEGRDVAVIDELVGSQGRRWPREIWIAIVAVAGILVVGGLGGLTPFGTAPALILAAIWYFGYYRRRPQRTGPPRSPASDPRAVGPSGIGAPQHPGLGPLPDPTAGVPGWAAAPGRVPGSAAPPTPPPALPVDPGQLEASRRAAFLAHPDPVGLYSEAAPAAPARVDRRTGRPARRLRLIALVVVGLTLAGLGAASATGATIPLAAYFAGALLVVGITLIAAAWVGRARGILPLGLLLALAAAGTTVAGPLAEAHDWGVVQRSYVEVAEFPPGGDRLQAGRMTVDLRGLRMPTDATYAAHVDLGSLEVRAPQHANVRLRYAAESGMVTAFGRDVAGGSGVRGVVEAPGSRTTRPTLTLDLSVGQGQLQVVR